MKLVPIWGWAGGAGRSLTGALVTATNGVSLRTYQQNAACGTALANKETPIYMSYLTLNKFKV